MIYALLVTLVARELWEIPVATLATGYAILDYSLFVETLYPRRAGSLTNFPLATQLSPRFFPEPVFSDSLFENSAVENSSNNEHAR